jgi:putative membrane protein
MQRLSIVLVGLLAGCLAIACRVGSNNSKPIAAANDESGTNIGSAIQDAQMVAALAAMEYGVIAWAKAAGKHSRNSSVHQMAGMLQKDHALLLKQLQQYAANRNINMPATATPADERELAGMLDNTKPAGFDKEWCANMLARHEKIIAAMEDDATVAVDTALRAWINDVLPKVRMHRDELMQIKYTIR